MEHKRNIIILNNKIITDKRTHRVYPTTRQKKLLVDILEKNPKMIYKFDAQFTYEDSLKLWEEATKTLNAISGAKKTVKGWKKCWHDLRRNTKLKVARINSYQESGELEEIHLKIMKLDSSRSENVVIENIKRENEDYYLTESPSLDPDINFSNYSLQKDISVNTDKDSITFEERKLQLKKEYYDSKLKILDKQTMIQEQMLNVLKGIATSIINKI